MCPKSSTRISALKRHVVIHSNEECFTCDICEKVFENEAYVKLHIQKTHSKIFSSGTFGTVLKQNKKCPRKGEKPYLCPKAFFASSSLNRHIKTHDCANSLPCQYCNKNIWNKPDLKIHERMHTREKPFMCSGCARCFYSLRALQ